jgi:hypothetical protein
MSKELLDRELFEFLKNKYNPDPTKAMCPINRTQLRSDVVLGSSSQYKFNITTNSGATATSSENWLEQNDVFIATGWAFLLGQKLTATTANGVKKLYTYPNSIQFGTNADNLMALYNGKLNLTIQSTVWLKTIGLLTSLNQSVSQQGVIVSQPTTLNASLITDSIDFSTIFNDLGGYITIPGNQQPSLTVNCDAVDMTKTSYTNYAIVMFDGYLVQNGAQY